MKKKIIIADVSSKTINGKSTGHSFAVSKNYSEIFKTEYKAMVAGGPIYTGNFDNLIELPHNTNYESPLKSKIKIILNCSYLFKKARASNANIILQCNSVATVYLGIILFGAKNNINMIQYNKLGLDSIIKKILYFFAKKKIKGIICTSDSIGVAYGKPYCVIPDYLITQEESNKVDFDKSMIKYDIGIFGIITEDKGVLEAAKYFTKTSLKVKIAGKPVDDSIRMRLIEICEGHNNINLNLSYLSEEEYRNAIKECKYCLLNYSQAYSEHSSGVVYDILFNGRPVIGKKCKFLDFISYEKIGYIYSDISQIKKLFGRNDKEYELLQKNIRKYFEKHISYNRKLIEHVTRGE